jgi:hypothetical protein
MLCLFGRVKHPLAHARSYDVDSISKSTRWRSQPPNLYADLAVVISGFPGFLLFWRFAEIIGNRCTVVGEDLEDLSPRR